jgi:hypothetical protein
MNFTLQYPNGDQNSKSKKITYYGMNKHPNEKRKEIGWGIAEKHFAENAPFFGVYNYA